MKEMKKRMRAAILTLCGTLSLAMSSCKEDNASNPVENPDQSKYTLEQLQSIAHGAWLDDMQLTATDNVRLYNIDDNGQCDIYDFANNDEDSEEDAATTYTGTWSVTRDLSKLHFIDQLNISGFELIGGLMIQVKMKVDESAEPYKTFAANGLNYEVEVKDTLAMLRNQQTGDMTFIDRNDANLIALIIETGQFSDKAATRAASKTSLEERIKKMVADNDLTLNTLQKINGKQLDNSDYIGRYYKGLNPRICDMSILGAGGVPTCYLTKDLGKETLLDYKRQHLYIRGLWELGVRYFDLGTIYKGDNDRIYFYDEDMKYVYPGVKPDQIFKELSDLLKEHPSETAIIMLDQAPKLDNKKMQDVSLLLNEELKTVLGRDRIVATYGPDLRLDDCRGKLIVMNNYEAPLAENYLGVSMHNVWSNDIKTGEIAFPLNKKGKGTVQAFNFIGLLSITQKHAAIEKGLQIANESAKSVEPHWVLNHVAGRYGIPEMAMRYNVNATMSNEHIGHVLLNRKYAKTGIMVVDYVGITQANNTTIPTPPHGVDLIAPIIGANYYASKNHLISLAEDDVVK